MERIIFTYGTDKPTKTMALGVAKQPNSGFYAPDALAAAKYDVASPVYFSATYSLTTEEMDRLSKSSRDHFELVYDAAIWARDIFDKGYGDLDRALALEASARALVHSITDRRISCDVCSAGCLSDGEFTELFIAKEPESSNPTPQQQQLMN